MSDGISVGISVGRAGASSVVVTVRSTVLVTVTGAGGSRSASAAAPRQRKKKAMAASRVRPKRMPRSIGSAPPDFFAGRIFIAPTYYWGLTLNTQSILTPDLGYFIHPPLEFTMYWVLHIAVLAAPVVLVWGMGHRPRWSWLRVTAGWSAGWMGVTMLVNAVTDSNYGYLNGLPPGPSLLDHLGPWPWYLVTGLGLLGVVWAVVMTWPWERLSRADTSGTRRGCVPPSPAR